MSEDEASHSEEEEEEEEEEETKKPAHEESEAEQAMKKRREAAQRQNTTGLDESAKDLLESNRHERERMEDEIRELRQRNERRKKEREIEEKRLASERAAEDERRRAAEEAKRRQKSEEEERRQKERAKKMAEFEKWKNPPKPNFVIAKRSESTEEDDEEDEEKTEGAKGKKSKEQLEMEKRAILKQRIKPLEIEGFDAAKLAEKAKELHNLIYRLEGEKYDLEKHFKAQQFDMMELAERARQANKVGKGGLKRIQPGPDDNVDKIQERFAGAPAKIEMYSKYERQKDKRSYDERLTLYTGPQFIYPPERIKPTKIIRWSEEGLPIYASANDLDQHADGAPEAVAAEE